MVFNMDLLLLGFNDMDGFVPNAQGVRGSMSNRAPLGGRLQNRA
jgi:hypothetical protein